MARHEDDREDLMREAAALVRRAEFLLPGAADPVVAGFRKAGDLSIYFGPDPVFHLDAQGKLRRAFVGGRLFRTQGQTLAQLTRHRTESTTELLRHDLSENELDEFLKMARETLSAFRNQLADGTASIVRSLACEGEEFVQELIERIDVILNAGIPLAPSIHGKR